MKREAMAEDEQQQQLPLTIDDEEEETSMSHWHPNSLRRVKKEEAPTDEMDMQQNIVNNGKGRNEVVEHAPTKMLLRERKRAPNAGFDGNGKKEMRRGRAKK